MEEKWPENRRLTRLDHEEGVCVPKTLSRVDGVAESPKLAE
jgi:hypothetical protein